MISEKPELLPYDNLEEYPHIIPRIASTYMEFLKNPIRLLDDIRNTSSGEDSIYFVLAVAWPITAISEIFKYYCFQHDQLKSQFFPYSKTHDVSFLGTVIYILLVPISIAISLWIFSAINHGMLWCWRALGDSAGFGQTSRATGFVIGLTTLLTIPLSVLASIVPKLRVHSIFNLVVTLMCLAYLALALSKVHRSQIWRSFCAVVTPPILIISIISIFSKQSPLGFLLP